MKSSMWIVFALLGALFAAIVNVISKKALDAMDLIVALMVQAALALGTLGIIFAVKNRFAGWSAAPRRAVLLMALAGVFTGVAWACGYRALQLSDVNHASPIDKLSLPIAVLLAILFLKEKPTLINWIGITLMLIGAICVSRAHTSSPS